MLLYLCARSRHLYLLQKLQPLTTKVLLEIISIPSWRKPSCLSTLHKNELILSVFRSCPRVKAAGTKLTWLEKRLTTPSFISSFLSFPSYLSSYKKNLSRNSFHFHSTHASNQLKISSPSSATCWLPIQCNSMHSIKRLLIILTWCSLGSRGEGDFTYLICTGTTSWWRSW
jgi:hypothetical protein